MHREALEIVDTLLERCIGRQMVLDVGSYDVNGTFRPLVAGRRGWQYTGLDVRDGPNVDVVAEEAYRWPLPDSAFSVAICGNMLHNVRAPWRLAAEMYRVLKPGGMAIIVAPGMLDYPSRYPEDCWRVYPAGMLGLLEETGFRRVETWVEARDTVGVGYKP